MVILGSTGSIGRAAAEIAARAPEDFVITGLAAGSNSTELKKQLGMFPEARFSLRDESNLSDLIGRDSSLGSRNTGTGEEGLLTLLEETSADIVVNALVGISGLLPTIKALDMGCSVALANKEALVTGGRLIIDMIHSEPGRIIPVDSEHFSLSRCLYGTRGDTVGIILTASGGPFYKRDFNSLADVTVEEVLDHPTWKMGKKVTVDSALLLNKGLEVIEAHWLFGFPYDSIDVVIHPQSLIHSLTRMKDGSLLAHLGPTDMRLPLMNAMYYPEIKDYPWKTLSMKDLGSLEFVPFDPVRYPAFELTLQAGKAGGIAPTVLNAADEVAVATFLSGRIGFLTIIEWIEEALNAFTNISNESVDDILEADRWTRNLLSERYDVAVVT